MTITATFQAELGGVTLGRSTLYYEFAAAPQGFGIPDLRTADQPRAFAHGELGSDDYMNGRKIVLDVWVLGVDDADAEANLLALKAAWSPVSANEELQVRLADQTYSLFGRPRGCTAALDLAKNGGTIRARLEFKALDPLLYGASSDVAMALASVSGSGMTFPATFDLSFGGAIAGGISSVTNSGTVDAPWVARLDGPLTNPSLENVTTGEILELSGTLAAGEYLILDSSAHTILLGGTSSRYSWFTVGSTWFDLVPGVNQIRLSADAGSGSGTLTYRSAWI